MLEIVVPDGELYDEKTNSFITIKGQTLQLEHSLVSLSKWEEKWHKPFLSREQKTTEETIDYIRCMTKNTHVNPLIYYNLSSEDIRAIHEYIEDPHTATTFTKQGPKKPNREIITNEIIYYWMSELNIPPEYAKWHLNHLLTLIELASIKKTPPKKRSVKDTVKYFDSLNEQRKAMLNTKG